MSYLFLLSALFLVPAAYGGEWHYSLEDELGYSTNISRTADNEIDEFTNALRVGVSYEENSVNVEGGAALNVEHLSYLSGVFNNEIRGYLNADLRWVLFRERLFWEVEDVLSITPVTSRQAWTPGNMQQTNVFSTGPSFSYRFDNAVHMTADMRYMNAYAEETDDFNSDRWYLGASLIKEYSLLTDISANVTWRDVDFDNEYADDYQQVGLFAAWERRFGQSDLRLELGGLRINFDRGDSEDGPYGRLVWNRLISSTSQLMLGLNHGFSDAAQQISGGARTVPASSSIISSQVYTNSELELTYRTELAQSALEAGLGYQKQVFLDSPDLDQQLFNMRIVWGKSVGGGASADLGISYMHTLYELDNRNDNTLTPFAGLRFQRSSHLFYRFRAEWQQRDSSEDNSDYSDLMLFAMISYRR